MVLAHSLFVGRGPNIIKYMVSDIQLILVRPFSSDVVAKIQVILFGPPSIWKLVNPLDSNLVGFGPCLSHLTQ